MGPTFKQIMFQCAVHVQLTPCGKCHNGNGLRNSSQKKKKEKMKRVWEGLRINHSEEFEQHFEK